MDAMLILERTPGQAIIIGGEVRVEVTETSFPEVRLRITRLLAGVRPRLVGPGNEVGVVANIGDFTMIKHEGQSLGIGRSTVHIERVYDDRVLLAVEHGDDINIFGEEVWDALGPG
jgi:sRNA-binding carbon storage regulator CsrA